MERNGATVIGCPWTRRLQFVPTTMTLTFAASRARTALPILSSSRCARSLHASVSRPKEGLNRFSRTITQPKDQGASQVCPCILHGTLHKRAHSANLRPCSMLQTALTQRKTCKKPWSASQASGDPCSGFPLLTFLLRLDTQV